MSALGSTRVAYLKYYKNTSKHVQGITSSEIAVTIFLPHSDNISNHHRQVIYQEEKRHKVNAHAEVRGRWGGCVSLFVPVADINIIYFKTKWHAGANKNEYMADDKISRKVYWPAWCRYFWKDIIHFLCIILIFITRWTRK